MNQRTSQETIRERLNHLSRRRRSPPPPARAVPVSNPLPGVQTADAKELLRYRTKAQTVAREVGLAVDLADSIGSTVSGSGEGAAAAGGSGGGGGGGDSLSLKLLGARLPHGEALAIRLEFVGFVVSKSKLELTFELVGKMWRQFLGSPLCGVYFFNVAGRGYVRACTLTTLAG